jgi:hypothetical protein
MDPKCQFIMVAAEAFVAARSLLEEAESEF